jgi:hypothetical protein
VVESALATSGWFLKDREIRIDAAWVAQTIAAGADPRAGYLDVVRAATLPADDVMMRRLDGGLIAVLGQLEAKANWHRISREWWLWPDEEPSTELGEREHAFFRR